VLAAFRRAGVRVILVGLQEPPAQISRAIDEFVCIRPLPRRARVTHEITSVAANRVARHVAETVCKRLDAGFIYQRYDPFLTCGVEVGRCVGVPVVVEWNASVVWTRNNWHERGAFWHLMTPLLEQAEGYVAAEADLVAAVSTHAAQMAVDSGTPPQRVMTVPNAVDLEDVDAGRALAASRPKNCLAGWVGSFGPWHGAEVLVQAMSLLPERVRAVMIGDGNNRPAAERLARRLGVWERIDWTGELPHAEAIRRLSECEVLVSPHVPLEGGQRFFGSPTKLFEYMAIGRPIVASALDQLAEVLTADETARLVRPGDPNELARGILWMIENPTQARRLGAAARAEAMSRHTWDVRVRAILKRLSGTAR
jgi:glycosyltransferase involved in cell wall biosynthesis